MRETGPAGPAQELIEVTLKARVDKVENVEKRGDNSGKFARQSASFFVCSDFSVPSDFFLSSPD